MVVLKRVGVVKAACFLGLFGVFTGFIFGLIMFIVTLVISNLFRSASSINGVSSLGVLSSFGANSWYLFLLIFPLISGIINFLIGLIFTPIANLVLKIIKGLDLEIVE